MPTYTFRNNDTNEVYDKLVKMSELDQYLADNPNIVQIVSAPTITRDVGTNLKVSEGFRESISKIKETYKINNIKSY